MKFNKKDWINLLIYLFLIIVIVFIVVEKDYLFGSKIDWVSQHYAFPEYFRALFYDTGNLLPDFAFNIGNGQNIYNFSYYGLLSPIILISYLLPFIKMSTYIQISSITMAYLSVVLFYKWLRNNNMSVKTSFISGFIFMCAAPLLFHSHRHIMFINYMPFLIMGLMGVDKYIKGSKKWLIVLSVFLMIMTSFYYSVSGIITLGIYFIYKYLGKEKIVKFKDLVISTLKFIGPVFIGIAMSAIIILPTFYVILTGRGETTVSINILDLLIPKINTEYILYDSYGVGLTSIVLVALINMFKDKKDKKWLGTILSLLVIFPVFNYIMNAGMYIDAKILIPALPLYVFTISIFIEEMFKNKIKYKLIIPVFILVIILAFFAKNPYYNYFLIDAVAVITILLIYRKTKRELLFIAPLLIVSICICIGTSKADMLVTRKTLYSKDALGLEKSIEKVVKMDQDLYRISNTLNLVDNVNNTYANMRYNFSTVYSSTYNMNYNKFYFDTINNPIQSRTRLITTSTRNALFLMLTGNKYYVGGDIKLLGYDLIDKDNKIYKSNDTLPIAYASSNLLSEREFNDLKEVERGEALLKNIVVKNTSKKGFTSNVISISLNIKDINYTDVKISKKENYHLITAEEDGKMDIYLNEKLKNQVLFIRFELLEGQGCGIGDMQININNVNNKLTCNSWKYHNKNYQFDYVLPYDNISVLNLKFKKGIYKIKNIEMFTLDYNKIKEINREVDTLNIDINKTKGDKIVGNINVSKSGYFTASIPYEKGFVAKVDGKKVEVEKVNTAFIGFPIKEGNHKIEIEYKAPFKNTGLLISVLGAVSYLILVVYDNKKDTLK